MAWACGEVTDSCVGGHVVNVRRMVGPHGILVRIWKILRTFRDAEDLPYSPCHCLVGCLLSTLTDVYHSSPMDFMW